MTGTSWDTDSLELYTRPPGKDTFTSISNEERDLDRLQTMILENEEIQRTYTHAKIARFTSHRKWAASLSKTDKRIWESYISRLIGVPVKEEQ